jgi:tetratricopeptide (TPR) repeat protein
LTEALLVEAWRPPARHVDRDRPHVRSRVDRANAPERLLRRHERRRVSGRLVHDGDTPNEILVSAATKAARPLAEVVPEVAAAVAGVVDRALAFDKADRWPSAEAMSTAVVAALGGDVGSRPSTLERVQVPPALAESVEEPTPGGSLDTSGRVVQGHVLSANLRERTTRTMRLPTERLTTSEGATRRALRGRSRLVAAALVSVAALTAGGAVAWRRGALHAPAPRSSAPAASSAHHVPATPEAAAAFEAGIQADHDGNPVAAERYFRAAVASDPALGAAHLRLALMHASQYGRESEAHAAYHHAVEQCLRSSPAAISCVDARIKDESEAGRCTEAEADARTLIAIDLESSSGYLKLASALFSLGSPDAAVLEALQQADARTTGTESERHVEQLETAVRSALLRGDFDALGAAVTAQVEHAQAVHNTIDALSYAVDRIEVALEVGDANGARVAIDRAASLFPVLDTTAQDTGQGTRLVFALARAGVITREEFHRRQAALVALYEQDSVRRGKLNDPFYIWATYYAIPARTEVDGREAIDALARYGGRAQPLMQAKAWAGQIGAVYALAGQYADAIPPLETRVELCSQLDNIAAAMRAQYLLGLSREKTGDAAGARAAYDRVLAHWGNAKPRSVTADKARAGLARLAKLH